MSSTIGDTLRLTLFGRSHGPVIGMTLAGIPAGKALSPAALQAFLNRRAPGRSPLSTARREADVPRFLSGLNGSVTTGEDITPSSKIPTSAPPIMRYFPPYPGRDTRTTPPM